MIRLVVCWAVASIVVLAGCDYKDPPEVTPVVKGPSEVAMQSTVLLEVSNEHGLLGYGSGVSFRYIIHEDMRFSTQILTAAHVTADLEAMEAKLTARFWMGTFWSEQLPATVRASDEDRDLAVVEVPFAAPYLATLGWNTPKRYEEVYTTGVSAVQVPLPDNGQVTGKLYHYTTISAHVEFGRSGGAVFGRDESGNWVVVGIIQAVGMQGVPTHHIALMCPIEVVRVWLLEVNDQL